MNIKLFSLLIIVLFLSSCSEDVKDPLSGAKKIIKFTILNKDAVIKESTKKIDLELPKDTDLSNLSPTIELSPKASVDPSSGTSQDFTNPVIYTVTAENGSNTKYTVKITEEESKIYTFNYKDKKYEIVKINKTWKDAVSYATGRGGYLAEIESSGEDAAIYNELKNNASIVISKSKAIDGGGSSYVWIGGNDIAKEGKWIWDGNNDGTGAQFWQGGRDGSAINGLYNNWGNEPDNYKGSQDGLSIALNAWPLGSGSLGSPGEWNDVDINNKLYFVIEYD